MRRTVALPGLPGLAAGAGARCGAVWCVAAWCRAAWCGAGCCGVRVRWCGSAETTTGISRRWPTRIAAEGPRWLWEISSAVQAW
ncbi:hypothetical protein [Nocardioides ungokensis]|uniref:hypothetical protein n=1 Tax=Nocardioides ungokensis TaxID=1643322 RepID=UPI001FE3D647|nr:hypothetical protein [Nocardioides ungokensis]